ncbi:MAG: hypothetical protein HYZ37_02070 [Candidatus Solibacter usitatus]|nr:hypothetical protein [Candidatus Solibacter usitatus]
MEPGTRIEVTLLAGGKVNGRLGKVSERTLELLPVKSAVDGPRVLEWDSVSGVKNLEKRMSRGVYVLIGVGIAVGALAAIGYGLLRGFGR